MLLFILSGKQRLESLEIDDFQSGHVEHMLNQHGLLTDCHREVKLGQFMRL